MSETCPRQLADECLPTRLAGIMTRTDTEPGQLWLEITETALVEDLDQARKALRQIDELGVRVSIDDFGTGWASLTYLREFPVHALKIDRLFVDGLGRESSDLAIVKSILALGCELGLDVIAEGIETLNQSAVLRELGCETGQGYFSPAAPPESPRQMARRPPTSRRPRRPSTNMTNVIDSIDRGRPWRRLGCDIKRLARMSETPAQSATIRLRRARTPPDGSVL